MTVRWALAGPAVGLALLLVAGLPAQAQSFDSFDNDGLDGFDLGTDGLDDPNAPVQPDSGIVDDGPALQPLQDNGDVELIVRPRAGTPVTSVSQPSATQGDRVTLRALDKTLGRPTDVDIAVGETVLFGRIAISLVECRYPSTDPSSDAYAHLQIFDPEGNGLFDGWMVASSPALNALEHPRYDVWVLTCEAG